MFLIRRNLKIIVLSFWIFLPIFFSKQVLTDFESSKYNIKNKEFYSNIKWKKVNQEKQYENEIIWKKSDSIPLEKEYFIFEKTNKYLPPKLGILGRSIVFDNSIVGPDISWIVPPGLAWNKKYKFDFLARGHNTRIPEPETKNFFGWNDGDAVGLFSYQFLQFKQSSLGLNIGVRSLYNGDKAIGGTTGLGEGLSSGFRWDYALSDRSGFAFGAEQLIHFNNDTDTGRNIYLTASKAWWKGKDELGNDSFPLYVGTAGVRHSIENPHPYITSNIVGFFNVLECCRNYNVENLIYASSSSIYGGIKKIPFSEDQLAEHPLSLYAATKKSNELIAHSYSHLYNLPCTGLRFFTVYGPWGRPDMAPMIFTKSIIENKPIKVFNYGKMKRDFTYIDDIVEAISKCCYKPATPTKSLDSCNSSSSISNAPHKIFNVGNGNSIEILEFIEILEKELGVKSIKDFVPIQLGDVEVTEANTSKIYDWIGFRPKTNLKVGLSAFVKWYKNYYKSI